MKYIFFWKIIYFQVGLSDAKLLQSEIPRSKLLIFDADHSSGEVQIEAALKEATANYS
ncbi:MAG: hypothetical protein ACJATI_000044 [Halioglobus sp.]|jgi:hypothetical protein